MEEAVLAIEQNKHIVFIHFSYFPLKIIPTKTIITKDNKSLRELLEILSQQAKNECLENLAVLKEPAKGYKDSYIIAHLLVEYNRIAFVRLMTLLNKEGIENNIRNILMRL